MLLGEIDTVPGEQPHYVATRYFAFVGPLIPFKTMCVTHESFERHGNRSTHSYSGEDLKLSFASIALGYVRVWSWILVFALPFILHWGESVHAEQFISSAVAAVVGIASLLLPKLFTRERTKRLTVLRRVTGLGCDPSRRHEWARNEALESLTARLGETSTSSEALKNLSVEQAELVFAWAWYRGDEKLREAAWQTLK